MKKILVYVVSIVLMAILTGYGSDGGTTVVNGEKITNDQINTLVKAQQAIASGQKFPDKTIRKNVLESLVSQTLLKQEALKEGITVPEKDLEERYRQTLNNWKTNNEMQKSLSAQGFTQSNMRELLKTQMIIQALAQKISRVSDEGISAYYNAHANNYTLYTIEQFIAPSEKEASVAIMDPSKMKILIFPANQLPYLIQQQLHSGHKYETSEVVKIDDTTWWAFKIDAITTQTFEKVKNQVKQAAEAEQQAYKIQALLQELKGKANISTEK